jgi:hypothetical protein
LQMVCKQYNVQRPSPEMSHKCPGRWNAFNRLKCTEAAVSTLWRQVPWNTSRSAGWCIRGNKSPEPRAISWSSQVKGNPNHSWLVVFAAVGNHPY